MVLRWIVTPVLTVAALAGAQVPAHAQSGHVHMVIQLVNPAFDDDNQLLFEVEVGNLGPDTATGVRTIRNVLYCATPATPLTECVNTQPVVKQMRDIPVGGQDVFAAVIPVPERAVTVRTTIQIEQINEHDDFSVPGSCNYGQVPQDDCDTEVITLSR